MAHRELTYMERRRIEDLLAEKVPVVSIAMDLGRHRSTVYREIKRNAFRDAECPELAGYYGMVAHGTAKVRRARRRKLIREPELRGAVEDRLKAGWSPEQIAGRLKHEGSPLTVCHETIYTHAYGHKDLARHLPRRQKQRKPRRSRKPRDLVFPESCRIKHRPKEVAEREVFGHWEADLMIFRREHGPANVATMVERKTRYAVLFKNNDRKSKPIMDTIINTLAPLPADARQSITFDRGFEFSAWRELGTGMAPKPGSAIRKRRGRKEPSKT